MNNHEFRALLDLLMCADPYPAPVGEDVLKEFANKQAKGRGFVDWIDAYHCHEA